ncbi:MAG: RHS repeat-associated core domain-containing protein [Phycisphaerales bacterium]|nr:RHS repeat-associated core domain-containing protein [Phycisphaerales bacterium]
MYQFIEIYGRGTHYDFGARYYDSRIGRWFSVDPFALKYTYLSPYNFVDNSPIYSKDGDGRDIIVLCSSPFKPDPETFHPTGHQAVLIGNAVQGWDYYSYDNDFKDDNGNNNYSKSLHFNSIEDFKNSAHNTFKKDYDDGMNLATSNRDKDGKIIQRYDIGYQIATSAVTDKKMKEAAANVFKSSYSIFTGNQCTAVPRAALNAAGLEDGEVSTVELLFLSGRGATYKLPSHKQKLIDARNSGVDISNQLNRSDNSFKRFDKKSNNKGDKDKKKKHTPHTPKNNVHCPRF